MRWMWGCDGPRLCNTLEYTNILKSMPKEIDFKFEENIDNTIASQELACVAGVCEI